MKRLVIKFGGTSLMDTRRIQRAAEIVMTAKSQGFEVITVVSAMGHTTDHLISLASDLSNNAHAREMDLLMTTGEQVSVSLMSIAIRSLGGKAHAFTGAAAGIITDSNHGNAKIRTIRKERLERTLRQGVIPVVAGFQGLSEDGEITTLGRGGSDTTAVALAAVLHAEYCDIYSDVKGIFSADPNVMDRAYVLDAISYSEMLELAKNGAQVLHDRSVQIAMDHSVKIRVRSTFLPNDDGTIVTHQAAQINPFTSIACSTKENCITIKLSAAACDKLKTQRALRHHRAEWKRFLLKQLHHAGLAVEPGSSLKNCPTELSFCLSKADSEKAKKLLMQYITPETEDQITLSQNLAKISVVGGKLDSAFEVDAILKLTKDNIPITMIARAKNRISIFVPEECKEKALSILHANCCILAQVA